MDAIRRLRPVLACSASVMFVATAAAAGPPCEGDCCESPGACAPTLDECGACPKGGFCDSNGWGGACSRCGRRSSGFGSDGVRRWSDEWYAIHGNGPIGAEQKCHAGKLWPPYPRPQENAPCSSLFHAAHYWPYPYNCWDRSWVRHTLAVQNGNGWAQATTLCAYHFDPETHRLNDSGRIHLRWILEQTPPEFRTVYVQAANDHVISGARQQAVESEAASIVGSGAAPIIVRPVQLAGRPANEVDSIRRSEIQTIPQPRIEVKSVGTGSGDGT